MIPVRSLKEPYQVPGKDYYGARYLQSFPLGAKCSQLTFSRYDKRCPVGTTSAALGQSRTTLCMIRA